MKRKTQSVLLAGLLVVGLAGCKSTGMYDSDSAATGGTGSSSTASEMTSTTGDTGGMAGTGSGTGETHSGTATGNATEPAATGTAQSGAPAGAPNGTVTSIEVVQRQGAGAATGAGTVAGAAVGGTSGATMTGDRVYRVTLRMDDGRTHTITQEWAPSFSTGDRVRMSSGTIER